MEVAFENIRQSERITEDILPLKELMEHRFNLSRQVNGGKKLVFTLNKVMRVCLIASLSLSDKRNIDDLKDIQMSKTSVRIMPSFFTKDNNKSLFSALLKLRYKDCDIDWQDSSIVGRIVAKEMYRGMKYLMDEDNLNSFLFVQNGRRRSSNSIPPLDLLIGEYGDDLKRLLILTVARLPMHKCLWQVLLVRVRPISFLSLYNRCDRCLQIRHIQ